MPWLWLAVPAALALVAGLWLRTTLARKREAAALAARQEAEQQARQAAQARAQAQAAAELRAAEEATRQLAQARLQAQREAAAAEREERRRAADEAARAHAQSRAAEFAARADEAARQAAALRRAAPPPPPPQSTPPSPPPPPPLPTPTRAEAPATPAPASVARRPQETLVMVVDDSKVVRVKVSRLLVAQGYRVAVAENGLAALQQMETEVPQVVITDAEMPGMDGLELTRQVRAHAHTVAVPVIMISSADASLAPRAAAAGVTVLLGKPYGDDQLLEHLSRARRGAAHETAHGVRA